MLFGNWGREGVQLHTDFNLVLSRRLRGPSGDPADRIPGGGGIEGAYLYCERSYWVLSDCCGDLILCSGSSGALFLLSVR